MSAIGGALGGALFSSLTRLQDRLSGVHRIIPKDDRERLFMDIL